MEKHLLAHDYSNKKEKKKHVIKKYKKEKINKRAKIVEKILNMYDNGKTLDSCDYMYKFKLELNTRNHAIYTGSGPNSHLLVYKNNNISELSEPFYVKLKEMKNVSL